MMSDGDTWLWIFSWAFCGVEFFLYQPHVLIFVKEEVVLFQRFCVVCLVFSFRYKGVGSVMFSERKILTFLFVHDDQVLHFVCLCDYGAVFV